MSTGILLLVIFAFCLSIRIPIAYSLGVTTIAVLMFTGAIPMDLVIQTYYSASDSFTLLALPFFIFAGDIMLEGGISNRLVKFSRAMVGNKTGSLGIVAVLTCMIFAAISGSGPATTAAIGGLVIPAMIKEGYNVGYASALTATSGAMGPIIPPSISFILYGIIAQVSITELFMAGFIPGILMAVVLCIATYYSAKKHNFGIQSEKTTLKEKIEALNDAKWSLLVPVIILGGIYGGIFTPTEAAIAACDYGLIIGIFVYKEIKIKSIPKILANSALTSGTVLILVGTACALGRLMVVERIPEMLASAILGMTSNKILILLIINIFLFFVGMVLDILSALIILTPLLLAIVTPLGVSPVHFGVIMVVNLAIGMCTPPVGVNIFVASGIAKIPVERMFKWLAFYVATLLIALMLITYIPAISTFLPNMFLK